ncbi:hypothetical protein BC828DRAFT_409066 [Blastocladiella britannica]|nr:hypothetical protein BC828DRAFT_409066 [Blastocladiella britannica]
MHHLRSDLDDLVPGSGLAFDVLQLEISIGQSGQGLFAFSVAIQSHLPITPALLATRLVCKTVDELAGRIVQVITTAWIVGRTQFLAPLMSIHDDWSAVTYALKLRGAAAAPATVPAVHVRFRVTPAASVDRQAVAKLRMHRRAASSSSSSAPAAHTPRFVEWIPLVVSELAVLVAPDPAVVKVSAAAMDPLRVLIHDHTLSATASPTAIADALRAAMVWGHVLAWVETDLAPASLLGPEFPRAVMRSLSSAAVWLSHEIVIHLTLMAPGAVVIECPAWVSTAVLLREMQSGTAAAGDTTSSMMLSSATLVARPTSVVVALSLLPAVLAAYARLHANNSTLFVVHDVLVARQQPSWAVEKFKLGMKPATDDLAQKRTDAERASAADRPAALAAVAAATRTFDAAKAAALAAMKFSGLLVLEVSIDTVRVSAPLRFPQSQGQLLGTLVCDGRRVVVVPPPSGTDGAAGAAAPIPKEQLAIYTQAQDLISDTCTRALAAAVATGDSPRARAPTVAGFQAALSAMLQLPMPALAVLARAMAALREATSSVPNGANGHDNTDLPPGPVLLLQPPPRSAISPRSAADATVLPEHPASCLLLSRLAAVRFVIEPVPGVLVPLMYDTPREAVMAWPASSGGAATSSGPGSLAASSSAGAGAGSGVAAPSHSGSAMRAMGASALLAQLSSSSPAPIANGGGEPADATAATATASTGDGAEDTGAEAGTAVMVPEHSVAEILSEVKAAGYGSGSGTEPHLVVRDVVLRVLGTRQ